VQLLCGAVRVNHAACRPGATHTRPRRRRLHAATTTTTTLQVEAGVPLSASDLSPHSLVTKRYALSAGAALRLAVMRQWTFFARNTAFIVFRLLQIIVMGLIVGSLFWQVPPDRTGVRTLLGASFISLLFLAFGSAPELGLLLMNRP
jgi:hypothetical protein